MTKAKTQQSGTKGRKPAEDPAIYRYYIKLNSVEKADLEAMFLKSGLDYKSEFIKSVLFNRPIKVVKVDKGVQDYYMRLTHIYAQFQKVGTNYNQLVKALKTNFGEKRALVLLNKLEKITIELVVLSRQIIELTNEIQKRWSQI